MAERVVADLRVAAPLDAVWRALREPRELTRWFGWDHDGLGAEIELIFSEAAEADAAAGVVDTGDVRLHVQPAGEGATRLRISRAATASPPDQIDDGWLQFAHQLRFALERHPGEDRTARRMARPRPLPAGEPWFHGRDDLFGLVVQDGAALLVVDGEEATLSRYGPAPER